VVFRTRERRNVCAREIACGVMVAGGGRGSWDTEGQVCGGPHRLRRQEPVLCGKVCCQRAVQTTKQERVGFAFRCGVVALCAETNLVGSARCVVVKMPRRERTRRRRRRAYASVEAAACSPCGARQKRGGARRRSRAARLRARAQASLRWRVTP